MNRRMYECMHSAKHALLLQGADGYNCETEEGRG